ncbi:hypothetical protein K9L16_02700 [Candidatus Pacearchaeota archaeon]|nr:hypothetical protein [Candidatus Pacearchaeota archaeon]
MKQKYIFLVSLLFILLAVGVGYYSILGNETVGKDYAVALEGCMNLPVSEDASEGFRCIRNISIISGELKFCDNIKKYAQNEYTETNYNICLEEVIAFSHLKNETDLCEDIYPITKIVSSGLVLDFNKKNADCITDIAVKNKNPRVCNFVASRVSAEDCILKTYIAIGDIENCGTLRYDHAYCEEQIALQNNS